MMRVDLPVSQNGLLIEKATNHLVMMKMLKKVVKKNKVSLNSVEEMLVVDVEEPEEVLAEQEMLERLKNVMVIGIVLHVETTILQEEQNAISVEKPVEMVVVDSVEAEVVVVHEEELVVLEMQAHSKNVKEIGIVQDVETTISHSVQSVINVEQQEAMEEVVVVGAVEEEVVVEDLSETVEEEVVVHSEIVEVVVVDAVVVIEVVEDEVDLENEKVLGALRIKERARKLNSTNR